VAEKHRRIDSVALPLGELFRRPSELAVPVYQRDFAWTAEEVGTLWTDLTTAISEERGEYFLGAITVAKSDRQNTYHIVDGQQRLAVVAMIFSAIKKAWEDRGDSRRANGVFRDYLGAEDRRTGIVHPKLSLNETNDPLFQSAVIERRSPSTDQKRSLLSSNRLLLDAQIQVDAALAEWLTGKQDVDSSLVDIEEFLDKSVTVILIEADEEADAFVLFETLNDRGLDLAVSDLVKNYLFSLAGAHYLERFKQAWVEITTLVGSQNLTTFLRHCWLSEYGLVRERELYRALRNRVRGTASAREFVDKLRHRAELYDALSSSDHNYWSAASPETRDHLVALSLFKVVQCRPVLLAAMETSDPEFVGRVVHLLLVVSFRYTVISQLGTGNLERIYTDCALAIRSGKAKRIHDVFSVLKPAYVDDARFVADFAARHFTNAQIARYILAQINDDLESDPERRVAEPSGRVTLEHILPKKPGDEWALLLDKQPDAVGYVDLIGNLTLLEKGKNRGLGNAAFAEKRNHGYASSSLVLNRALAEIDDWTINQIEKRSKELAKVAQRVWRYHY